MSRTISNEEKASFETNGYLILTDLLSAREIEDLQGWAQEVHDWPNDETTPWMPYDEINVDGKRVLCRTENYVNSHAGFNSLLRGEKLLSVLRQLSEGHDMLLFKEKINYKLAGSGGFVAHLDSTAYTHVKQISHLAILIAVDASDMLNGALEVVNGSHKMKVPLGSDNCIEPNWIREQEWTPVELNAGEVLIFGSYLAHRSGANGSNVDRKAVYATYNRACEGDLHDQYYKQRKKEWPPSHLQKPGDEFEKGALRYAFGSPMLSVEVGYQLAV